MCASFRHEHWQIASRPVILLTWPKFIRAGNGAYVDARPALELAASRLLIAVSPGGDTEPSRAHGLQKGVWWGAPSWHHPLRMSGVITPKPPNFPPLQGWPQRAEGTFNSGR